MTEERNLDGVSLFERGVAAAAVYLKRKGFEVLEENPEADAGEFTIVALDEAFFEEAGAGFVDRPARYDRIDIHPIGEDRAIIKHRINGLS